MLPAALIKWQKQEFEDVAYFEPFYLKEYVAAKPVVKGLK
jgi:tRNA A37 threonylcarbamoyladenosine modification protein TsaB